MSIELLRELDNFADARAQLAALGEKAGEWAGLPMPIEGERLVCEPRQAFANLFNQAQPAPAEGESYAVRNRWWSRRLRKDVFIYEDDDGRIKGVALARASRFSMEFHTLGCSFAWGIEQEGRALQLLGTLIKHHAFKQYVMTGMFMERSARSGLTYVFRKLRPTVVIDARDQSQQTPAKVLAALCAHPIAYYADTFAGAMTPTDDVIAHLMMMRGDEVMFWKRSTQHAPDRPEAMIL